MLPTDGNIFMATNKSEDIDFSHRLFPQIESISINNISGDVNDLDSIGLTSLPVEHPSYYRAHPSAQDLHRLVCLVEDGSVWISLWQQVSIHVCYHLSLLLSLTFLYEADGGILTTFVFHYKSNCSAHYFCCRLIVREILR